MTQFKPSTLGMAQSPLNVAGSFLGVASSVRQGARRGFEARPRSSSAFFPLSVRHAAGSK